MKGKISVKTIIIIVILLLVGVLGVLGISTAKTYLSGASSDLMPKNVVAKVSEDGKSATITWTSDKAAMGVVEYGTTPASLLLRSPESEQSMSHSVNLTPLKGGTNYYYRIRIGEDIYDNDGVPYNFKTKAAATPSPTIFVPTVALLPTGTATGSGEGSCDRATDYNKDGVVNSLDYMACLKGGTTGTTVTPTSGAGSTCTTTIDYDGNGVINSLDRIKCLQTKK